MVAFLPFFSEPLLPPSGLGRYFWGKYFLTVGRVLPVVKLSAPSLTTVRPGWRVRQTQRACALRDDLLGDNTHLGDFVEDLALMGLEWKIGLFCPDICSRKTPALGCRRTGM